MVILYFLWLFAVLVLTSFIFTSLYRGFFFKKFGTPWVPLTKRKIRRLLKLADLNEDTVLYDLGSGDGRIILTAVQEFRVKQAIGIEISLFLYWVAQLKRRFLDSGVKRDKVSFKRNDFFKEDLSQASVIICYLLPGTLEKLKPKFTRELRPGTLILCFTFPIHGWHPIKIDKPTAKDQPIYVYKI